MLLEINIPKAKSVVVDMEQQSKDLGYLAMSVGKVKRSHVFSGGNMSGVSRMLEQIISSIEKDENAVCTMKNGLSEAVSAYERCESEILLNNKGVVTPDDIAGEAINEWNWKDTWDKIGKVVGNLGIVGSTVDGLGRIITSDGTVKDWTKIGKSLSKVVGGVAGEISKGADASWGKALIGWADALSDLDTSSASKTFISSLKKQFGKDLGFGGSIKNEAGAVKVGSKWAGHLFTVIGEGVDNYDEYASGEISGGRAVAETVIESAVSIGATAVATAAISAGLTAIGVTAAPVALVGAGAALVVMGADAVCKWAFGKDMGELASDALCDLGETISDGLKDVGEKATSVIKDVAESGKKMVSGVVDGVQDFFNVGTKWSKKIFAFG